MDTVTVKFSHLQAELPKYIFSNCVAITNNYQLNYTLMPKSSIPTLQSQWEADADAERHCTAVALLIAAPARTTNARKAVALPSKTLPKGYPTPALGSERLS